MAHRPFRFGAQLPSAKSATEWRDLARRIVGAGEDWLTELSTTELRELVALRPGAEG